MNKLITQIMKKNVAMLLSLIVIAGCSKNESETDAKAQPVQPTTQPTLVVAVGKVEPENELITLSAPAGGIVKSILKQGGDHVSKGEALLQLENDLEESKANEIRMQIQSQRSQIELEQTQLKESQVNLENKSSLLSKTKRLLATGAESQQAYDDLASETKVLELKVERSNASVQLATNKLNELLAQLKTSEIENQKKLFKAPADGVVLEMQLAKGESVNQYSTYAEFAPDGKLMVRAEVDELFSDQIKTGQKVDVGFTGNDKVIATGEIVMVSPYLKKKSLLSENPGDQEDRRVREIRVALKDPGSLIINSKVECKIQL